MLLVSLLTSLAGCGDKDGSDSGSHSGGADGGASSLLDAGEGGIAGRVCQPDGSGWQEGAQVYTHLVVDGQVVDTAETHTDAEGRFQLDGLHAAHAYDLFIQLGAERLLDQESYGVEVLADQVVQLPEPACPPDLDSIAITVVSGDYDGFGYLLEQLGDGSYARVDGLDPVALAAFLDDTAALAAVEVLLIDGGVAEEGVLYEPGGGCSAATEARLANLRAFVDGGGLLFASDWSYDFVERGWPADLAFVGDDGGPDSAQLGLPGTYQVYVRDATLAAALGVNAVEVEVDVGFWPAIDAVGGAVGTHLAGAVEVELDGAALELVDSPLLVSFRSGAGAVAFGGLPMVAYRDVGGPALLDHLLRNLQAR